MAAQRQEAEVGEKLETGLVAAGIIRKQILDIFTTDPHSRGQPMPAIDDYFDAANAVAPGRPAYELRLAIRDVRVEWLVEEAGDRLVVDGDRRGVR